MFLGMRFRDVLRKIAIHVGERLRGATAVMALNLADVSEPGGYLVLIPGSPAKGRVVNIKAALVSLA
jgi:hypothetical protein